MFSFNKLYLVAAVFYLTYFGRMTMARKVISTEFEVFGKVQGVFFRKNAEIEAKRLGIRGWCMNTKNNSVKGVLEGSPETVALMKNWLEVKGSPGSRIDKAVFTNEKTLVDYTYSDFKIKR